MASYTGIQIVKHQTLAASVVDTLTFANDYASVEVKNRGTADIYFRLGSTNPAVGADDSYIVQPGEALLISNDWTSDSVRLISSGTPAYTVTGVGRRT